MAIEILEGLDDITTISDLTAKGKLDISGAPTVETTAGRFGGGAVRINATSELLGKVIAYKTFVRLNFWLNVTTFPSVDTHVVHTHSIASLSTNTNGSGVGLKVTSTGALILQGDGADKGQTADGTITQGTYAHIEIIANILQSGSAKLFVDGVEKLDLTGDFLDNVSNGSITFFTSSASISYLVDDIVYETDSSTFTPFGETRIQLLAPDADTATTDWVRSSGSNDFEMVDEAPHDSDTTYISSATLNAKSSFDLSDLADTPATIHAVQLEHVSRKDDAVARGVTGFVDSGGTIGNGVEASMTTSYAFASDIFLLDPNGSIAWTATTVNALKAGVEVTT